MGLHDALLSGIASTTSAAASTVTLTITSSAGPQERLIWFLTGSGDLGGTMVLNEAATVKYQNQINEATTLKVKCSMPIRTMASNAITISTAA